MVQRCYGHIDGGVISIVVGSIIVIDPSLRTVRVLSSINFVRVLPSQSFILPSLRLVQITTNVVISTSASLLSMSLF